MSGQPGGSGLVAAVFALLLGIFGLTNPGILNAVDSWAALGEAAALVERGDVDYSRLDPSVAGGEVSNATRTQDRSHFGFGLNAVYVPLYVAAKAVGAVAGRPPMTVAKSAMSFVGAFAGAATGAIVAAILLELGFAAAVAALVAIGVSLGTFLWPLAGISYSDPLQTALLAAVFLQALRVRRMADGRGLHLLGALAFAAAAVKPFHAIAAVILATPCLAPPAVRRRAVGVAAIWGGVLVACWCAFNRMRWGSPFSSGYSQSLTQFEPLRGTRQLLVSFDRGLVWFFPLFPAALLGLRTLTRRDPWAGVPLVAAFALSLLMLLGFEDRHGGNCLGPRYLLLAVPVLAPGLAELVASAGRRGRIAWTAAFAVSAAWVLPMALLQWYLPVVVANRVDAAGGTPREEPAPMTFARLLAEKTPTGPDRVDLAAFSTTPVAAHLDLVHRDNSGWAPWWIKQHPDMPGWLRLAGAASLAALAAAAAVRLRRAVATGEPTTGRPPPPDPS